MDDLLTPSLPREEMREKLRVLAQQGIYVGTSSWKYEGWLGLLYTPERYHTRGKISRTKFQQNCLAEYAEIFPSVCLDASYYQFPHASWLEGIYHPLPAIFRLSLKVTEDITVKRFPVLPRHGARGGTINERFLDAGLFRANFLAPLEPYRPQIGTIIFEFSRFHLGDWDRGRQFVEALDAFLSRLPKEWNYAVEVRNRSLLVPEYFEMLRRHGVAHTFNSWTHMPPIDEQLAMPGSNTADFAAARFLLKPGRTHEQAEVFQPFSQIREPCAAARRALADFMKPGAGLAQLRYLYVANRLEGCSPRTINAVLADLQTQNPKALASN